MEILQGLYEDRMAVELKSTVECYMPHALERRDYLLYTDNECFNNISFRIVETNNKIRAYMSGLFIQFNDYNQLLENLDGNDEHAFNLANNVRNHISPSETAQNIFLNLFINGGMTCHTEAYLYVHLKDMLYSMLHHVPQYIAGYITRNAYDIVGDNLKKQGYETVNENGFYLELIYKDDK